MSEAIPMVILLVGITIVLALLIKPAFDSIGMPSLVGYLVLGFILRLAELNWGLLSVEAEEVYEFLSNVGLICLLFAVGLKSNLVGLVRQLRRASSIWIANILASGISGYITSSFFLGLGLIPSLFIALALTATSVGVALAIWKEANALNSPNGELVIDVAELDDLSGIILMALLLTIVPVLQGGMKIPLPPVLARTLGMFLLKLIIFGAFCFLFSRYVEHAVTNFFQKIEPPPDSMILVVGTGFIIAALAGLLGLSVAIGAFFAGLVFSRDPRAVRIEGSFIPLYEFFTPFFFIGIGLSIDPYTLTAALGLGLILLIIAIFGKAIGTFIPALITVGWSGSILLSASMIPRAEIAMVIMQRARILGEWAVPPQVFSAMVVVSAGTCIVSPIVLRALLRRWPQATSEEVA